MAENASPPNLQRNLDRQHQRYVEKHERARGIVKAKPAIGLVITHHQRAITEAASRAALRLPLLRAKRLPRVGTVIDHVIFGLGVVRERVKGQIRVSFRKHGEKVFQEAFLSVDKFTIKPTRKARK